MHGEATTKPRLLELFCGTKSIGKEFEKVGYEVVSVDIDPQFNPTICADVLTLDVNALGWFDAVWASPICNSFSVAVIGRNWHHDHTPKTDSARYGLRLLETTVGIIKTLEAKNPKLQWWFENPRGKMRRMPIVQDLRRVTAAYCQYGDTRQKPTDIWTNTNWMPKPMCGPGATCHEAAPRGSKTGTQGIKGSRDRAIIPVELCREIAEYAKAGMRSARPLTQPELPGLFINRVSDGHLPRTPAA